MAFEIDDVVRIARDLHQDPAADRYPDQQYVDALNMAISDMMRIRPDIPAWYPSLAGYPYATSDLGSNVVIPVDDRFMSPLVSYVTGFVQLTDDDFSVNGRAAMLLQRFQSQLMMGG